MARTVLNIHELCERSHNIINYNDMQHGSTSYTLSLIAVKFSHLTCAKIVADV
jgi:hypothetical protein